MTNEQNEALDKMIEWRDGLHSKIKKDDEMGILWDNPVMAMAWIAIRNVMNDVAVSFGRESFVQDSSLATATN